MVLDMWSTSSKYSIFILNTLEPKYTVLVLHLHVHCLKQTDEMQGLVQFLVHINMCIHPLPCLLQQITHLLAWKTKIKEAFSKRKKYQKMLVLFFFFTWHLFINLLHHVGCFFSQSILHYIWKDKLDIYEFLTRS